MRHFDWATTMLAPKHVLALREAEDADGPLHRPGVDKNRARADIDEMLATITAPA